MVHSGYTKAKATTVLLWVFITLGAVGGLSSATYAVIANHQQSVTQKNIAVRVCITGRVGIVLQEVGEAVISNEEFTDNPELSEAFSKLDDTLAVVDVDDACEQFESNVEDTNGS